MAIIRTLLPLAVALSQIPAQSAASAAESSPLTNRPSFRNLDTPRDFPEITSRQEWPERAKEIREQVLVSCGLWPMPEKTPLNAHIFGKVERDGYSVEKVYLQTFPRFYLGGNLYRLALKFSVSGMAQFPELGDSSVSAVSAGYGDVLLPGMVR